MQSCRGSHTHTRAEEPERRGQRLRVHQRDGWRPTGDRDGELQGTSPGDAAHHAADRRRAVTVAGRRGQGPAGCPAERSDRQRPAADASTRPPARSTASRTRRRRRCTRPARTGRRHRRPTPATTSRRIPEIGLAAGACEGNGLLIDISDPANPVRIDAVSDNRYAYWHGATFSNDGKTVVFTDEWGGGTAARCRATDDLSWGADAIYDIVDSKLVFRSYYKLPVAQTLQENCVSHLPSLIPVPGRNIMTQAWYQGGLSVIDFTDSAHPKEIALLRPRADQRHRARAGRPLVDLLLQRRHLRLRDRPRLRRVEADPDRGAVGERDQGRERGAR